MNIRNVIFIVFLLSLTPTNAFSEQKFSFGIGGGYFQGGGLGVNIALKGDHDMKYLGTGVAGYKETDGDADIAYGVTLGWLRTDILAKESGKHGLGIVLGIMGGEGWDTNFSIGPSYAYFFKGVSQPGFNVGVAAGPVFSEDKTNVTGCVQVGYQF